MKYKISTYRSKESMGEILPTWNYIFLVNGTNTTEVQRAYFWQVFFVIYFSCFFIHSSSISSSNSLKLKFIKESFMCFLYVFSRQQKYYWSSKG